MIEKYRVLFFRYLYQKLKLNEIEDYLINNKINCITNVNNMCEEEKICSKYSKYFYLLNDIELFMLNEDELMYLRRVREDSELTEKLIEFLNNTYEKVMLSDSRGKNKYYGAMSDSFMAKDNQIVLGLKRDEMGFSAHKLKTMEEMKHDDIIIKEVIEKIEKNSVFDIKVIKYNELFEKHRRGN